MPAESRVREPQETTVPVAMARIVRILMAAQNVSTDEVAKAADVPRRTFYRRLSGAHDFSASEIATLAAFFEVPPSVFFMSPDELLANIRKPEFFPEHVLAA